MASTNSPVSLKDSFLLEELKAVKAAGFFDDPVDFIKESINTFLAARKDVRIAMTCELYKEGKISLGKASEIADLDIEEIKEELSKKGIKRKLTGIKDEKEMADTFVRKK